MEMRGSTTRLLMMVMSLSLMSTGIWNCFLLQQQSVGKVAEPDDMPHMSQKNNGSNGNNDGNVKVKNPPVVLEAPKPNSNNKDDNARPGGGGVSRPLFDSFPAAKTTNNSYQRAICLLSFGKNAMEFYVVERVLHSIRKRGQFLGPVMLLTDAPVARYQYLTEIDPYLLLINPPYEDWNWDMSGSMPYKRFKTYQLEYLEKDSRLESVDYVYYLDIDIVVGRPLFEWFDHVEQTYFSSTQHNQESTIIFFEGTSDRYPYQGGQFVLKRNTSQYCLERWRYYIDEQEKMSTANLTQMFNTTEKYVIGRVDGGKFDQHALVMAGKEDNGKCRLQAMKLSPYLTFVDPETMEDLIRTHDYSTLMHVKNTQHGRKISRRTKKKFYGQLLDLSDEESELLKKDFIHVDLAWSKLQISNLKKNTE